MKAGFDMFKRLLIFVLVITMLSLASCKVVEVIDHGTTLPQDETNPQETTAPQTEYSPWGFWHSYEDCVAVELIETNNAIKLYSLTAGYYEYYDVIETTYTREGDVFTVVVEDKTYTFSFDKFANNLKMSLPSEGQAINFLSVEKTPAEHPKYSHSDFAELNASSYVTVEEIDFSPIAKLVFEAAPYSIALNYYGDMRYFPTLQTPNRPAQSGDVVNIDYCGKLDGVAFSGGTASGAMAFLSDYDNKFIPGFTDGIIGHSVGETFDVPITFPESYWDTNMAGKAVVFTMTLNSICDMTLTDEAVAKDQTNTYETYAQWIEAEELKATKKLVANAILNATETNKPLPSDSYLYYYQQQMDYYHMMAYYYGVDFSFLMSYYGLDDMTIMQQAVNQAAYNVALFNLMEKHNLSWTDEEFGEKYQELISDFLESNPDASNEDATAYADGMKNQIELELAEEKVLIWSFALVFPSQNQ